MRGAMAEAKDNHTQAARLLGIHRTTLIEKVKRSGPGRLSQVKAWVGGLDL